MIRELLQVKFETMKKIQELARRRYLESPSSKGRMPTISGRIMNK